MPINGKTTLTKSNTTTSTITTPVVTINNGTAADTSAKTAAPATTIPKVEEPSPKSITSSDFSSGLHIEGSISIKEQLQEKEEKAANSLSNDNKPTEDFTKETLLEVWEGYRKQLINEGKIMFASAFDAAPELEKHLIKFKLENKALEDEFIQLKPEILDYFRATLNNYQLDFETSINKDKSNKKAFTPDEKYQKMLEKNPLLAQFRERLDLDVGY